MKPYRAIPIGGKDFVYGWYVKTHNSDGNSTHWIIKDRLYVTDILIGIDPKFPKQLQGCYKVIPETVGQQVGKQDKNDKEIYDGDIIKWDDKHLGKIEEVRWNCEDANFYTHNKKDEGSWLTGIDKIGIIIGNIHQDSELIK